MSDFHSHEPSGGLNLFESVGVDYDSVYDLTELADRINNIAEEMNADFEVEFDSKLQSLAADNPPTHIDDCIELAKTAAEQLINEYGDDIDLDSCGNSLHEITSEADCFSKLGFDSDDLDELNLLAYQPDDIFQSLPEKEVGIGLIEEIIEKEGVAEVMKVGEAKGWNGIAVNGYTLESEDEFSQ